MIGCVTWRWALVSMLFRGRWVGVGHRFGFAPGGVGVHEETVRSDDRTATGFVAVLGQHVVRYSQILQAATHPRLQLSPLRVKDMRNDY